MRVSDGEQGSIGFQPVPGDHCAWPCEIGDDEGAVQSRRSIDAGDRLEAYATFVPWPRRPSLSEIQDPR